MTNPRADYSPIFHRPPLKLPGNARIAIWPVINVEEWDINEAMARAVLPTPQGVGVTPDIANFGWFDYGLRVGFWRFKQVLDRHGIRATVSLNASVCQSYPQLVQESLDSGWEMLGHGYIQRVINKEPDERAVIKRTIETIEAFTGEKLRGWMGPGLTQTEITPDLLVEAGFEYTADWILDDQPCEINTDNGTLYSVPYTTELNDIPIMLSQSHVSSVLYDRTMDYVDVLYKEGKDNVRVMSVAVHPYIHGVPHRIKYFRKIFEELSGRPGVVFMTGAQILDWYLAQQD